MERMAARFNESLTGATQGQFGQISEALGTTALLLQGMNSQFGLTGNVLNELMDAAKRTAANETASRENHLEQVTEVVGDLMGKLQNHAGESVGSMEKALAAITCDMSRRMTELSAQMASVVENISERSAGSAKEVLDQAGAHGLRHHDQQIDVVRADDQDRSREEGVSVGQHAP